MIPYEDDIINEVKTPSIAEDLMLNGVSVYPIPKGLIENFNIPKFLAEQKEYLYIDGLTKFVISNFGAHGNPSSFHHPEVRDFRLSIFDFIKQSLKNEPDFCEKYIQLLPDRFSRRFGAQSGETWHRDASIEYIHFPNSTILGGWINLDDNSDQFFSCILGSHIEPDPGEGFSKLSKDNAKNYKERRTLIRIPPRHGISFNELIIHEIAPIKVNEVSHRLYMKYHLSSELISAFDVKIINNAIQNQGSFPMNKWNFMPMYEKLHLNFWKKKLIEFSKNIKQPFLTIKTTKIKNKENIVIKEEYVIVQKYMISLLESGVGMFPEYRPEEIAILFPQKINLL
jgi:hypothetical protein